MSSLTELRTLNVAFRSEGEVTAFTEQQKYRTGLCGCEPSLHRIILDMEKLGLETGRANSPFEVRDKGNFSAAETDVRVCKSRKSQAFS